jgi:hypothetical protein
MWGFIPLFLYKCISVFLEKHQWKSSRSCVKFFFYRPGFAWEVYRLIYLKFEISLLIYYLDCFPPCGLKFKSFPLVWEITARGSYNILVLELEHHVIGWLIYNFIYSIFQYFGLFGTCLYLTVLYFRVFDTPPLWDWIGFIKEDSWGVSPYLFTNIILQCWADNTLF